MRVTWVTLTLNDGDTNVQWGWTGSFNNIATGGVRTYTTGGWLGFIHSCVMTGLIPGMTYYYRVGSDDYGWSKNFTFNTLPLTIGTPLRPLRIASIADMGFGNYSRTTVNSLAALAAACWIDLVIHNGDVSYADGDEQHWDFFWRQIEPIASRVPYMTTPGEHERWSNFSAYKARTWMPLPGDGYPFGGMYYKLQVGPIAFLMMNSETALGTADLDKLQLQWAKDQLRIINYNRQQTPFIIPVHHRPLYCTTPDRADCDYGAAYLRMEAENLYMSQRVDMVLNGHLHGYERTWPVYNENVTSRTYKNPISPFYIVNGAGGNRYGNELPNQDQPWSVFGSAEVGFAVLTAMSSSLTRMSSLTIDFHQSMNGTLLDSVTLIKQT
jgi:hypothetical protein